MTYRLLNKMFLAVVLCTTLSACITATIAGVTIATVDILHDRRTAGEYIDDGGIELNAANYLLSNSDIRSAAHVKADSWNGILLLTGEIDNEETKRRVISYMNTIQGVRQVVDETTITGKSALLARTHDAWISSKVKGRLLLKTGLDANRIKVITTRGTVYLMGIVDQEEGEQATELTRTINGVARVVKVFEYNS